MTKEPNIQKYKKRGLFNSLISGSVLTSREFTLRLPIVLVASILVIIYMSVNFTIQRRYSYMQELRNEINHLRTISVTTSSQRQQLTRWQSIEKLMQQHAIVLERGDELPQVIEPKQ